MQTSSLHQLMGSALRPRGEIRLGLRLAMMEATAVAAMFSAVETWVVPLIQTHLGAAAATIGLLTLLPQISILGLGQWSDPIIRRLGGNKRAAVLAAATQATCLAALSLPLHVPGSRWAVPLAMGLMVVYGATAAIAGPAWTAWMGGVVPRRVAGHYSGRRFRLFHASRLTAAAGFAAIILWLPIAGSVAGLQIVFLLAAIGRGLSAWLQSRQPDPPPRPSRPAEHSGGMPLAVTSFWTFLATLPRTPFGRWTLVWAAMNAGIMVAAPFYVPFLIERIEGGGLGLADHPLLFSALVYCSTASRLLALPVAGRLVDAYGPGPALRVAALLLLLVPAGWAASRSLWSIAGAELVSGLAWSLIDCSLSVTLFHCHRDPRQRARLIAWHQMVVVASVVAGSALGTALMTWPVLPAMDGGPFVAVFLSSLLLRLPAAILALRLLPRLAERPDAPHDVRLWHLLPGAELAVQLGRGVYDRLRLADD